MVVSTETGALGSRWAGWFAAALVVAYLVAWWRLVSQPEEVLVTNVLVDDALYFALPARHLWQGAGFSFDGLEPTNGVQTLWALVCIALAGLFDDPIHMSRAMVGLSGLCWLVAAIWLFAWLRRRSPAAAVLAAVAFAWSGVTGRVAFQGMENGLHALLGVWVLWAGARAVAAGWSRRTTLVLGVALAAFALSRTEGAMLGPVVALPLVGGWLGGGERLGERLRSALWLALPGVVLVGSAMVCSKLWFDSFLPISGSVKDFYETSWGRASGRGPVLENIGYHLNLVRRLSLTSVLRLMPAWRLVAFGLVLVAIAGVVVGRGQARPRVSGARFAVCLVVYALVHLVVIGLYLPHFTSYATWYFATEMTAVWLVLGWLLGFATGWARVVPLVAAAALAVSGAVRGVDVEHDVRTNCFMKAGNWLRTHTPPGTRIGALSAGLVGFYACDQHVVNLDGLINNRRYLDEFLRKGRLADYFADRQLQWFADYQPLANWRAGISWCGTVPASRLVPRRYWRLADDHAYIVWQVLPPGSNFELLGPDGPAERDRYAELAVAAEVHGRFTVVDDQGLAAHPDLVVARSIPFGAPIELRHVLAAPGQLREIGLTEGSIEPDHRESFELEPGMAVLGYDLYEAVRGARRQLAVTVFRACDRRLPDTAAFLFVRTAAGDLTVPLGPVINHLAPSAWPIGLVVPETVVVDLGEAVDYRLGIARERDADRVHWFTR